MASAGDVFVFRDFKYRDSGVSNRTFIVLSDGEGDDYCVIAMVTKQERHYPDVVQGCNEGLKVFFAPTSWQKCFDVDSYIQLDRILHIQASEIRDGGMGGRIQLIATALTQQGCELLRGCLKKFRDDISGVYWKMIFG